MAPRKPTWSRRIVTAGISTVIVAAIGAAAPATVGHAESAKAAQSQVPKTRTQIKLSFSPIVKRVAPAVVNIYTKRIQRRVRSPFFDDPFFRRFFGRDYRGMPRRRLQGALGSGVIVRRDGVIITNNHVIRGADQITVVMADRREYEATVLLRDKRTDLAVLRVKAGKALPSIEIGDADSLEVGDLVLAVGNPFGVGRTVTSGIVSALARTTVGITDFRSFIQTDAAINPGNSGGALVSMDGKLVGINTAIYSKSGGSVGIGFAIPSTMVLAVLHSALTGKPLVRPWLGAQGQDVTPDIAASLGLKRVGGVIIRGFHRKSSAGEAGLKRGDVVTAVNGKVVTDGQALRYRLATLQVGDTAKLSIMRGRKSREIRIKLVGPPEDPPRNTATIGGFSPLTGATVANLSPRLAEELGNARADEGVIIMRVARGSPAYRLRLAPGDLVISVNGADIDRVSTLRTTMRQQLELWTIRVRRRGQLLTLRLRR